MIASGAVGWALSPDRANSAGQEAMDWLKKAGKAYAKEGIYIGGPLMAGTAFILNPSQAPVVPILAAHLGVHLATLAADNASSIKDACRVKLTHGAQKVVNATHAYFRNGLLFGTVEGFLALLAGGPWWAAGVFGANVFGQGVELLSDQQPI